MAAFCGCCGAEITPNAEACTACGTPRHGMMRPTPFSDDAPPSLTDAHPSSLLDPTLGNRG